MLMYKVHHHIYPPILLNLYHFHIPHTTTTSYEKSIAIQGPKVYNLLLNKVNIDLSLPSYKKHVVTFLES